MVGTVILGCLIANIILVAIFALVILLLFRKFQPKLVEVKGMVEEVAEKLKPAMDSVEKAVETISSVSDTINSIKEKLEKLPFLNA